MPLRIAADVHRGDDLPAPVADRRGDRHQPHFEFLIDDGPALLTDLRDRRLQFRRIGDRARRVRADSALRERLVERRVVECGQQHAAHRRTVRGQPAADRQIDRHDLVRRHAQHVDDLGAIEHGGRTAFVDARGQLFHHGLREIPERHRRQIGEAEFENLRREPEQPAVGLDVAERLQREQDAARARAREAGGRRDFGQRLLGTLRIERADHREAARKRLDVGIAGFLNVFGGHEQSE